MRIEKRKMKRQIVAALVIVVAAQLTNSGCRGTTEYVPPIRRAVFVSPDEAWVLTRRRSLERVSGNGSSSEATDAPRRIEGISFISPSQGWTVDSQWNVWHFDGARWAFVGHNTDNKFGLVSRSGVSFVDENVGWARTLEGLFITEDGGGTWKKVLVTEPGEFIDLYVVDRDTAFLYRPRASLRRTTDRGETWTYIDLGVEHDVTSLACRDRDSSECWAASGGEIFAISSDGSPKRVPFSTPKEMTITDICPFGEGGLLVSGFTLVRDGNPRPRGVLFTTSDEGATWRSVDVPQDDRFEQVASFGNTIWLASHTAIYRSSNAGASWIKLYESGSR